MPRNKISLFMNTTMTCYSTKEGNQMRIIFDYVLYSISKEMNQVRIILYKIYCEMSVVTEELVR